MLSTITKWGNSLGVRIPKSMSQELGMQEGEAVELSLNKNGIVIRKAYRLESLLAKVTPENSHTEIGTGSRVGKEQW